MYSQSTLNRRQRFRRSTLLAIRLLAAGCVGLPLRLAMPLTLLAWVCLDGGSAHAVTNRFFQTTQTAARVTTNMTSTTIQSGAYQFTYTVDGYWSSYPGGPPTGRFFSVFWPNGVQAQAITAGPDVGKGANITLERVDGQPFDFQTFTGKLLANTAATGGSFEIMPQLDGEDALPDPLMYDASGYAGMSFSHAPMLSGYDTYIIHLWVDYALTQLAVADDSLPPELQITAISSNRMRLTWPVSASGYTLQQTSNLSPASWATVTNAVSVVDAHHQVTVPSQGTTTCFRLVLP
jgi:hypothetical protein